MVTATDSPLGSLTRRYRSSATEVLEASAKKHKLGVHPDSTSFLIHDAIPGTGAVACAAVEGVTKLSSDELFGGKQPALMVYLPTSTLISGPALREGAYAATFDASQATARLSDAGGKHVADVSMEAGSVPNNDYLAAKRATTDIGDITLCTHLCVQVCFSIEIDAPGPINPKVKLCVKLEIDF
jgi:hypothetical protein